MPLIGILAAGDARHVTELGVALGRIGCEPIHFDPRHLTGSVASPSAIRAGPPLQDLDALVARLIPPGSLDQIVFYIDCLHILADSGLPVVNPPRALERTVDKHWTSRLLQAAGIPTPRTVATASFDEAMAAFRELRDVIVKPLLGSGGRGIFRVSDEDLAYRTFRALQMQRAVFYLQEFVPHGETDLRLFVVGGEVVAAARRVAASWKANVAAGATMVSHRATPQEEDLALRATAAVGADYAGVDLVEGPQGGPQVVEVNGIPGWMALQRTTPADIAATIARLVQERMRSPRDRTPLQETAHRSPR